MDLDRDTEPLWTSAEAATATGGRAVGRWLAGGVSIDTRDMAPGDLFIALKDKRDGHEFVLDAYAAGASAALVERRSGEGPALVVPNSLKGLQALGEAARDRCPARRVAVTGSVGKTSMKEALALIFGRVGRGHASERSFNNHWGVPLSLSRMPRAAERAVFELGMNHAGEIRVLADMVRPHIAVITKIAPAHLENLGSMEAIADAKAEIFEGLEPWGAAVIPGDDEFAERLGERAGAAGAGWLVRFGSDRQAEARLDAFEWDADSARGRVEIFGQAVSYHLKVGGPHWGQIAAASLAAAYLADVPLAEARDALEAFGALAGRGAVCEVAIPGGAFTVIDDAYNANPASMRASIQALGARAPGAGGRRIAILGEMKELGQQAAALHAALWADLDAARVDVVHVVGEGAASLYEAVSADRRGRYATHIDEVAGSLAADAGPGDVVLVKGSNSIGLAKAVEALKKRSV